MIAEVGRLLVGLGVVLVVLGVALILGGRAGLGRLPGDFSFGGSGARIYVPLATSVLLSLVVTVVLNLLLRR